MWCEMNLSCEFDLREDGVWKIIDDIGLCSFKFISGYHSLEVQDVMRVSWFVEEPFVGLMIDSKTTTYSYL